MCTAMWWRGDDGSFAVFFNRDESRLRPRSLPVRAAVSPEGVRFLAPRDPAGGGTWLMANERGVVVGVLNHYAAQARCPPGRRSRGELPVRAAGAADAAGAGAVLEGGRLADFAPFLFVAWDAVSARAWVWDGAELGAIEALVPPLTTSSYRTAEVLAWRRARFRERVPDPAAPGAREAMAACQLDAAHPDGAFNIRMDRADARTESVCRISVGGGRVVYEHGRRADDTVAPLDRSVCELALSR